MTTFEQSQRMRVWLPMQASVQLGAAIAVIIALVVGSVVFPASRSGAAASGPSASAGQALSRHVQTGAGLDPRLGALAQSHPNRNVEVIAQFDARVAPAMARADVRQVGGRVLATLHIINALAVRTSAAAATRLALIPGVRAVTLNSVVRAQSEPVASALLTTYNQTLGTTNLWTRLFAPATGAGIGVALIDTGVDGGLPDFRGANGNSRVIATAVVNPGATSVMDSYGHGTHVAGIIAGNGADRNANDPLRGHYAGVAPDANLVSIKIADDNGNATMLDVLYGIQFAVDYKSAYNIRVINLSLNSTTPDSYKVDPLDAAAEAAWFHGIVVVAAAGNRGTAPGAVDHAPANDPFVITVGATDEHGQTNPAQDTVASWSSRGVTQDGFRKPDVYAPGAHIVSVLAPDSYFAGACSACVVSGQYIRASGTSMAAPMISGVVADLLQLYPFWSPDQVKGALTGLVGHAVSSLGIVDAAALANLPFQFPANVGVTPSPMLIQASGSIDYTRSSWSRSRWSIATGSLSASFARSSWSCACGQTAPGGVDPTRSSWSQTDWSSVPDTSNLSG